MRLTENNPLKDFVSLKYTSKEPIFLDYDKGDAKVVEELLNKLGQLEDIEEEIGVDLVTLFKALKNGVYRFTIERQLIKDYVCLMDNCVSIGCRDKLSYSLFSSYDRTILFFQDYGKTWALTKEELK